MGYRLHPSCACPSTPIKLQSDQVSHHLLGKERNTEILYDTRGLHLQDLKCEELQNEQDAFFNKFQRKIKRERGRLERGSSDENTRHQSTVAHRQHLEHNLNKLLKMDSWNNQENLSTDWVFGEVKKQFFLGLIMELLCFLKGLPFRNTNWNSNRWMTGCLVF